MATNRYAVVEDGYIVTVVEYDPDSYPEFPTNFVLESDAIAQGLQRKPEPAADLTPEDQLIKDLSNVHTATADALRGYATAKAEE